MASKARVNAHIPVVVEEFSIDSDLRSIPVSLFVVHGLLSIDCCSRDHTWVHDWRAHVAEKWRVVPVVSYETLVLVGTLNLVTRLAVKETQGEIDSGVSLELCDVEIE